MTEQAAEVAHYNILKSDVDTNRQLYDSMLRNVQEAGMTSALRASNIRVVDSAIPPDTSLQTEDCLEFGTGPSCRSPFRLRLRRDARARRPEHPGPR